MQKLSNILPYFKNELKDISNEREITNFAYLTIKHILGFDVSDCILNSNYIISPKHKNQIFDVVSNLKSHKPIQYIFGETQFFGLTMHVGKAVLIPRPETEELVNWIIKDFKGKGNFLDIGTGSGCLIISLSKYLKGNFYGIDLSNNALRVAERNNKNHNTKVNFYQMDIIHDEFNQEILFDVIVSNPPYVLNSEKRFMQKNILNYEPHIALFVDDNDPLIYYKVIARKSRNILNKNGFLYFEINERCAKNIIDILLFEGFVNIELKKDINDKERMIKAMWK